MNEKIGQWIGKNPNMFGKIIATVLSGVGICLMVGAVKNWDWLYAADKSHQSGWSMGQISRYLGRTAARGIGFIGGIFLTAVGVFLIYAAFYK